MSLSLLIAELNKTLLDLQGSELPRTALLQEAESAIRILSKGRNVERLPSSWAVLKELQIDGITYEGFEKNIEPHTIKKLSLVKRGGYEQASILRDREFDALSLWVREATGSFIFISEVEPQTVYWVYPDFGEDLQQWFLTCLYGPHQKS